MNNEGHVHVSFRILTETRICHMSQEVIDVVLLLRRVS